MGFHKTLAFRGMSVSLPEALLEKCLCGKLRRRQHQSWSTVVIPPLALRLSQPTYHQLLEVDEDVSVVTYVGETLRMLQKVIAVADGDLRLHYDWYSMTLDTQKKDIISRIYVGNSDVLVPREKPQFEVFRYHAFRLF